MLLNAPFHILTFYNLKLKPIFLRSYIIDEHKAADDCAVENNKTFKLSCSVKAPDVC